MSIPESAITAARKAYDECEGIWTDDAVAVENIARTMHAYAQQMVKAERDAIAAMVDCSIHGHGCHKSELAAAIRARSKP